MSSKYTPDDFKRAVTLLNLIQGRGSHLYYCPFHSEKTASMNVNTDEGVYFCHGCKKGGTIGQLVWEKKHIGIGKLLGIDPVVRSFEVYERKVTVVEENPIQVWGSTLAIRESQEAVDYLKKRCIPLEVAEEAGGQFAESITMNDGLWKKRIIFPVFNQEGVKINFEGRDVTGTHPAKVLYPKGAVKPIYEWFKLDKEKPLFLVEGLLKLLVLRTDPFFINSSTTMGSHLSEYQIGQLKQFKKNIILIPDNDKAGSLFINQLEKLFGDRFSVLKIGNTRIKDVDEIPRKLGISVQEYRIKGGFVSEVKSMAF